MTAETACALHKNKLCWVLFAVGQNTLYTVEYLKEVNVMYCTSVFSNTNCLPLPKYFLLPLAGLAGRVRCERLLANRRLGAQVIAALIVMLLLLMLQSMLLFPQLEAFFP